MSQEQGVRRAALVTGCGKSDGMGQAIARQLAADGFRVTVTDLRPSGVPNRRQELVGSREPEGWEGLVTLVADINRQGGEASYVTGDIADDQDVARMVQHAVDFGGGRLDVLVNNAGAPQGADRQDVQSVPQEAFDRSVAVNLRGTYLMCREVIPVMREHRYGRIINIASRAGQVAAPWAAAYSAAKAGVIGMTRSIAMDVGPWGITVNAICPGLVATSRAILNPDPDLDVEAHLARSADFIPVGRVGLPQDIAACVSFFASESAGYITAQDLTVDGGGHTMFPVNRPVDD